MTMHLHQDSYDRRIREDRLNARVDFYAPFVVFPDGTLSTDRMETPWLSGLHAPGSVDGDADALTNESTERGWSLLTGYTGQYGYHGPVMHNSEVIGGALARDILSTPGVYVVLPVDYACTDECPSDCDGDHADGWAVAHRDLPAMPDGAILGYRECACCDVVFIGHPHGLCRECMDSECWTESECQRAEES